MKTNLDIKGSRLLGETQAALDTCRILVHQGGSRTTKTYSIAQACAIWLHSLPNITIDVVRKRYTDLQSTAEVAFWNVLKEHDLYYESRHHKSIREYHYEPLSSTIRFDGLNYASGRPNDALKGGSRDILWWNEPTDGTSEDWRQLSMRTSRLIVLDYNPDYAFSWIYEDVLSRDDVRLVVSTYEDGEGFVPAGQIAEIKRLVPTYQEVSGQLVFDWELTYKGEGQLVSGDINAWRVYGLGQRGAAVGTVYPNSSTCLAFPEGIDYAYGLDFGFTRPSSLVKVGLLPSRDALPDTLVWEEVFYETELTNDAIANRLPDETRLASQAIPIYADNAEPKSIQELYDAGFNVIPCDKAATVHEQIKFINKHRLALVDGSFNLIREARTYKWRTDKGGNAMDEPVKVNDHAMDAGRYGSYSHFALVDEFWLSL